MREYVGTAEKSKGASCLCGKVAIRPATCFFEGKEPMVDAYWSRRAQSRLCRLY